MFGAVGNPGATPRSPSAAPVSVEPCGAWPRGSRSHRSRGRHHRRRDQRPHPPAYRSTSSTVETDGLAHAHSFSGHGHQPDQRVIRRDGQRPWTLRCRRNQPGDVGARNLVGRRATAPTDQQIAWRHRQCGVEAVQLACESSHHRQSLLQPERLHALRLGGPLQARPRRSVSMPRCARGRR